MTKRKIEIRYLTSTCTDGLTEWPMPGCHGPVMLLWERSPVCGVWFLISIRPAPRGAA